MDLFSTLTAGAARFDKKRFGRDMSLFQSSRREEQGASQDVAAQRSAGAALPAALDFFGSHEKEREATKPEPARTASRERMPPLSRAELPAFLRTHELKLTGTDVPLPLRTWDDLETRWHLEPWLLENLQKGPWTTPTPIQCGAISVMLERRDLLAGAPTGSGKTLAFLLPTLQLLQKHTKLGFRAVLVSPTRELAQQIYEQLQLLTQGQAFRTCLLTNVTKKTSEALAKKKFDILITTPLRLVHAIQHEEVALHRVEMLVLDEADRLLEQGFLTQTDEILAACTNPNLRKALFSATLPAGVEELARTFMVDECRVLVGQKDSATATIDQRLEFTGSEDGKLHALRALIQAGGMQPPVLLFVQSIQRARELFHELVYDGLHVDVIHSERPKAQREAVIEAFRRGDIWLLICTELMARGIDFQGVNLVINYDFPQTVQSYIHRIGRTGRAGKQGRAITYFTKDDAPYLKSVVNVMRQSGCDVPEWMTQLPKPTCALRPAAAPWAAA
ncbi:ATP-dependent RNA helicase ROK1 [Malassezia restricta CBS 7877]|uniref:RNA helicase n=1 Tax=Malassezia restricta (strain ATCC 96810 / NBRC 103918 / CBS 7877) TaxID=425264 RepID=A0A3G2S422_MALR7|nr:ATP-dependent RNA helicase ROK1 [Malassezia restricta CBS 7877]